MTIELLKLKIHQICTFLLIETPSTRLTDIFGKKKDKLRPRFTPDAHGLRGGLSWRVVIEDHGGAASASSTSSGGGGVRRTSAPAVMATSSSAAGVFPLAASRLPPPPQHSEHDAFLAISPDSVLVVQASVMH